MKTPLLFLLLLGLNFLPNECLQAAGVRPSASIAPHAPPPPAPENPPSPPPSPSAPDIFSRVSLEHFLHALLQSAETPKIDDELRFFAAQVDYHGRPNVARDDIGRDLERTLERWPERHFTLLGVPQIERQSDGRVRLTFSVRYELRNGTRQKTGEARERIVLARTAPNELLIVALSGDPGA